MKDLTPPLSTDCLDVIVIGAGQAGLAISWHLARRRLRFLVIDAAPELGNSWRSRWDSLTLFSPVQYDALPGLAFPGRQDTYPTKDQVADYLRSYAEEFDLPVLLNTKAIRLERAEGRYVVHTSQGLLRSRQVVVATGAFQHPVVPELAAGLSDRVVQLHSAEYSNPADLPSGRIVVVGGGNSGLQIAEELAPTHQITLAMGSQPLSLPQRMLGRDLFWWMHRLGVLQKTADSPLARRVRSRGDLVIGSSRRRLRRAGVDFRPRVVDVERETFRFVDGSEVTADAVVWATGFRSDYSWIDVPEVVSGGAAVHQRGVTPARGLYFIGLPWQHTRGSSLLGFVKEDAEFLADQLLHVHRSALSIDGTARSFDGTPSPTPAAT